MAEQLEVDRTLDQARTDHDDALLLPGGVIGHGPWTLVEADVVRGITITSYPPLKTDLQNACAKWVDREVVLDRGIVSSRRPSDIPAFNTTMIEEFTKGRHGSAGARQLTHTHA